MKGHTTTFLSLCLAGSLALADDIGWKSSLHADMPDAAIAKTITTNSTQAALPDSGRAVEANPEGWWGTGFMVGTITSLGWESGFIWESGELDFLAGGGLSTVDTLYPAKEYKVSVKPEGRELWSILKPTKKTMVLNYRYPYWKNPFSTNSNYIATGIERPVNDFTETDSYQLFPGGIESRSVYGNGAVLKEKSSRGKIIHVARWGQTPLSHRCTVYLHRGGTAKKQVAENYYVTEWDYSNGEFEQVSHTRWVERDAVNVILLNTFSEDICRYAEDSARARADVSVDYSGLVPEPDSDESSLVNPRIHRIVIEDPVDEDIGE